jgi:hypothetical protein
MKKTRVKIRSKTVNQNGDRHVLLIFIGDGTSSKAVSWLTNDRSQPYFLKKYGKIWGLHSQNNTITFYSNQRAQIRLIAYAALGAYIDPY